MPVNAADPSREIQKRKSVKSVWSAVKNNRFLDFARNDMALVFKKDAALRVGPANFR
jgi:hypothetical protein